MSTGDLKRVGSDPEAICGRSKRQAIDLTDDDKDSTGSHTYDVDETTHLDESEEESSSSDESDDYDKVKRCPNCNSDDWDWSGRCKNIGHRCCIRCLDEDGDLCKLCKTIYRECNGCSDVVDKNSLKTHPKCVLETPCLCCKNCVKSNDENCPSCDRAEESDEDNSKTNEIEHDCPICTSDMYYTGDKCDVCNEIVCFSCIGDLDTMCFKCKVNQNPYYIH